MIEHRLLSSFQAPLLPQRFHAKTCQVCPIQALRITSANYCSFAFICSAFHPKHRLGGRLRVSSAREKLVCIILFICTSYLVEVSVWPSEARNGSLNSNVFQYLGMVLGEMDEGMVHSKVISLSG